MNRPLIRVGDSTSHGGTVKTGSANMIVDGQPVARVGDQASCPIHGDTKIDTGSSTYITDGRPTARDGDTTECGAILSASQHRYFIE